jgi:predicted O-methyltransferase YrrM
MFRRGVLQYAPTVQSNLILYQLKKQNMNDTPTHSPRAVTHIKEASQLLGFTMNCDDLTGNLLKTLAASKLGGRLLELGTGTGLSTVWIAEGMSKNATLWTVELEEKYSQVAQQALSNDKRIKFFVKDGTAFLERYKDEQFDLIFADTWPGKYWSLEIALNMVKIGGFYIIDDMIEQPNWPEGHAEKAKALLETLDQLQDFSITTLNWSTGIVICTRIN